MLINETYCKVLHIFNIHDRASFMCAVDMLVSVVSGTKGNDVSLSQ